LSNHTFAAAPPRRQRSSRPAARSAVAAPRLALLGLVVAILCTADRPLAAQQDTAAVVPLPPVSVNALRSALPLQRLPVSISVLGLEQPVGRGPGLAIADAVRGLPGLQLDDRHNQALGERLSIRGFGARSTFGIRGVRVLVDGVPATMPDGQTTLNHVDPSRIVAVELVRGAAGSFLGNAAGGALQLRTGARGMEGLELTSGANGLMRAGGAFELGREGSVYGSWQRHDGFRAYSESERAVLGGVYAHALAAGRLEAALHATRYDAENPGSLNAEQLAAAPDQANPNNVRQRTGERGVHAQLGLGWLGGLGASTVELRGHVGLRDLDNPIPPRVIELQRGFAGMRAQLTRSGVRGSLAAGAELEVQRDNRLNFINDAGRRGERVLDQRESVRGIAMFAQAAWIPAPAVQLFGAVRRDGYRFAVTDQLVGGEEPDDSGARLLSATSFTGGASVELSAGLQLAGNVGTAFETPTTTELANRPDGAGGFNPELEPERTVSGELAVRLARRSWAGELTVFRAAARDKLVPFEVPDLPGRQFFRNAGRVRHQGVELAASGRPLPALRLRAAYTRLDVRFREYLLDGQDYAGRRVPGVAGHRLEFYGHAEVARSLTLLVHAVQNGRVAVNDENDDVADAYTLLGGRLEYRGVAFGPLAATLHAGLENALGERYTAAVSVNAAGGRYFEPGPGRTGYLGVRLAPR